MLFPQWHIQRQPEEGSIVASDLWMTGLPVAPAPHWRPHGARGAGHAPECQGLNHMLVFTPFFLGRSLKIYTRKIRVQKEPSRQSLYTSPPGTQTPFTRCGCGSRESCDTCPVRSAAPRCLTAYRPMLCTQAKNHGTTIFTQSSHFITGLSLDHLVGNCCPQVSHSTWMEVQ